MNEWMNEWINEWMKLDDNRDNECDGIAENNNKGDSFIQSISIAPLQVHYYTEALPTQHGYCVGVSRWSATGIRIMIERTLNNGHVAIVVEAVMITIRQNKDKARQQIRWLLTTKLANKILKVIVIINSRFLECPQKRIHWKVGPLE